jgi:D-glycerate 3-kinase
MSSEENLRAFVAAERLPARYFDLFGETYSPLARRILAMAAEHGPGLVVGLCGAQGSGKSTLAGALKAWLEGAGLTAAAVSIDDFYLPREERRRLAAKVHPLLATRGPPGSHDPELAAEILERLGQPGRIPVPSFDKAQDTRRPVLEWPVARGPVDVILFEGWCVGARPEDEAALETPVNGLEREEDPAGVWRRYCNTALAGAYQDLFARLDLFVLLAAPSFEVVLGWRIEQERRLKERLQHEGLDLALTMDEPALRRFVSHYERLTRHILAEAPARADVVIALSEDRQPSWVKG